MEIIVLLAIAGFAYWWFFMRNKDQTPPSSS